MSKFKVMLQNPKTSQLGSITVTSWTAEDAAAEARTKLERVGFTEVVKCEAA